MRLHVALLTSFLVACAEEAPPPRTPKHHTPPPAPTGEQANADALARMQAAQEDERAAGLAATRAAQKKANEWKAQQAAEKDAAKKACDDSRAERVAHAKAIVTERLAAETRLMPHFVAIAKACRIVDKPTGAVTVQGTAGRWRVAPEMADDVQCSKTLPAGVTKADAYVVLWRLRDNGGGFPAPTGTIMQREDHHPGDDACQALDKAEGLDFDAIRFEDHDSPKMLLGR